MLLAGLKHMRNAASRSVKRLERATGKSLHKEWNRAPKAWGSIVKGGEADSEFIKALAQKDPHQFAMSLINTTNPGAFNDLYKIVQRDAARLAKQGKPPELAWDQLEDMVLRAFRNKSMDVSGVQAGEVEGAVEFLTGVNGKQLVKLLSQFEESGVGTIASRGGRENVDGVFRTKEGRQKWNNMKDIANALAIAQTRTPIRQGRGLLTTMTITGAAAGLFGLGAPFAVAAGAAVPLFRSLMRDHFGKVVAHPRYSQHVATIMREGMESRVGTRSMARLMGLMATDEEFRNEAMETGAAIQGIPTTIQQRAKEAEKLMNRALKWQARESRTKASYDRYYAPRRVQEEMN